jgi:alpha-glucosidase
MVPIYVRGGGIVPEQPVVQNTDEVPQGPLQISVYPGPDCRGSLYQDDGKTLAFQHGDTMLMQFACESRPDALLLKLSTTQTRYKPWWSETKFLFYGFGSKPRELTVDGKGVSDWQYDPGRGMVSVTLAAMQTANITITK